VIILEVVTSRYRQAKKFSMPLPPLPNGSITHEAGLFLDFLSLCPRIANVQFAIVGHGKYNFRTMRIEYTIANGVVCDR
jgi:hypothetical protein